MGFDFNKNKFCHYPRALGHNVDFFGYDKILFLFSTIFYKFRVPVSTSKWYASTFNYI